MDGSTGSRPLTREDVLAILRGHEHDFRRFGAKSLALFGSVARNEAHATSDLDMLVEFEGPATFDHYMGLKILLEDLLGCQVDLVMRKVLKPRLLAAVEQDAVRVA
jgi:predicted nucleotidyltransferase